MTRAKKTIEPALMPCATCGEPTALEHHCQKCRDIGGGYVLHPPDDCAFLAPLSPVGNHRNAAVTDCAYKCGRADCRYGKRYNRIGHEAAKTKRKVVWK